MEEVVSKVKELLFDRLDYIHCGSCRFYDDDTHCEECHRRNMTWKISEDTAESLAEEIYEIIIGETK